jgi:hypothetical protein
VVAEPKIKRRFWYGKATVQCVAGRCVERRDTLAAKFVLPHSYPPSQPPPRRCYRRATAATAVPPPRRHRRAAAAAPPPPRRHRCLLAATDATTITFNMAGDQVTPAQLATAVHGQWGPLRKGGVCYGAKYSGVLFTGTFKLCL